MNVQQLLDLDDAEFADELNENLGWNTDNDWALFADGQLMRRSAEALEQVQASLEMQLAKYAGQKPEWEVRTNNLLKLVTVRLKQLHRRIHGADGTESQRSRAWRACLHELCERIDGTSLESVLDDIEIPFDGLTLGQWYDRRLEKRAGRVAA